MIKKPKRGLHTAKGAVPKEDISNKFTIGDDLQKAPFTINDKMHDSYVSTINEHPYNSDDIVVRKVASKSYNRTPYFICSMDMILVINKMYRKTCLLLNYIINNIKYNENFITLTNKDILDIIGGKFPNEASKATRELVQAGIIAKSKTKKNTYIINHNYIFKGSYNNFIHQYINKYKDEC